MTYMAHPLNREQEKAVKAFLEALEVPYEVHTDKDDTQYLVSSANNTKRLQHAMDDEQKGKGIRISLDDIWK